MRHRLINIHRLPSFHYLSSLLVPRLQYYHCPKLPVPIIIQTPKGCFCSQLLSTPSRNFCTESSTKRHKLACKHAVQPLCWDKREPFARFIAVDGEHR